MPLPKTIHIAGVPIKIVVDDLSDDECFGYYSHDRKMIVISHVLVGKKLFDTVRHEMMEAALCLSGVGFCETMEQEAIVRCMEEVFFPAWDRFQKRMNR